MRSLLYHICLAGLLISALFVGCGKGPELSPTEKAQDFVRRSAEYRANGQFAEAERSIAEAIEVFSELNGETDLIQAYSNLSDIHIQSGKLSAALHSLATVRELHHRRSDRNGEVRTMIEIGMIDISLGNYDAATTVLTEAALTSELLRMKKQNAQSLYHLGRTHAIQHRHQIAAAYFSESSALFLVENDVPNALDAINAAIHSLLRIGSDEEAYRYLNQFENIVLTGGSAVNASEAYARCGFSFLKNERWETAKACFEKAAASTFPAAADGMTRIAPLVGLGEVLFNNFTYVESQQHFIKAYTIAKQYSNSAAQAYLMVRIADCEVNKSISVLTQERSIRALQFYEHAQNLFARTGILIGDAIVLHRIGTVKEALGDHHSAVVYYKRGFEKFTEASAVSYPVPDAVDPAALIRSGPNGADLYRRHAHRLIALLIKERKYSDALSIIERSRALAIRDELLKQKLTFRDPLKDSLYSAWEDALFGQRYGENELARFVKSGDHEYHGRLQKRTADSRRNGADALRKLTERYSEFNVIGASSDLPLRIPPSTTVLRYYHSGDESWVFAAQEGKEIVAVKLSSYGIILSEKMRRFSGSVATPNSLTDGFTALSEELYGLLIQPVERFGGQRFVIIAPEGFAKFPFHILTKNGKPLMEMIEVSYLPSMYLMKPAPVYPNMITNIASFGFSSDTRWGLEFQLRDIRSFFRNVQLYLNQSATLQRLDEVAGEALHLSTRFRSTIDNDHSFTLSDGTASLMGMTVPVSHMTALHTFPIVVLNDVTPGANAIAEMHSLLLLLNGSTGVIANEFPLTPKASRIFIEHFYSGYSSSMLPFPAYRKAVIELNKQRLPSEPSRSGAYFYFGL